MKIKLNENKRTVIGEMNERMSDKVSFELTNFISKRFNTSITEVLEDIKDGHILISDNKRFFSDFLFHEWLTASQLKEENVELFSKLLWYDYIFLEDRDYVARYSDGSLTVHIFCEKGRKNE